MRRLVRVVLCISVLIIVFTVPAAATKPTEVSGQWTDGWYTDPTVRRPSGPNCHVTTYNHHEWGTGSFRGTSESVFQINVHGACGTTAPNRDPANLHATGTFTGDLYLGGKKYSGSFDYRLDWQLTDPCPAPCEEDTFTGNLVILQGHGGFEGLHGVLEQWGRTGPRLMGGRVEYAGQVHFDPQP